MSDGKERPWTPGPWHWVDARTDEPWDGSEEGGFHLSLRTVEEFGTSETVEVEGKRYTSFRLPKFIISNAEDIHEVADAALIAAAPDLYEALEVFVKQWELYKTVEPAAPGNDRDYPSITMRRESWDQAAAALSRANPQGEEK